MSDAPTPMTIRWLCEECRYVMLDGERLVAPNPFEPEDMISGCPKCRAVERLVAACSRAGCKSEATCGLPIEEDYLWLCTEHHIERVRK